MLAVESLCVPSFEPFAPVCASATKHDLSQLDLRPDEGYSIPSHECRESNHVEVLSDGGMDTIQQYACAKVTQHKLRDSFYVVDLGRLALLHKAFVTALPRVQPFYAVKCNPDPAIMRALASLGCGFDCASAQEIRDVLATGVPPARIIFACPCKRPLDLECAVARSVKLMTFDCVDELEKLAEECPSAELVLRIRADDPTAVVQFGHKFGADPDTEADALLATAQRLGMRVVGVSFHIGSGAQTHGAYCMAIAAARRVFGAAAARGMRLTLLDIGGGFYGRFAPDGTVDIGGVAAAVNAALAQHFPEGGSEGVRVIAEPGRYFADACATYFAQVHTVKDRIGNAGAPAPHLATQAGAASDAVSTTADAAAPRRLYYITDGVYGSFNNIVYDHSAATARVMRSPALPPPTATDAAARVLSTVFGPTCDGVDLIFKDVAMPQLRRGDWLQFPAFGAYTVAGASGFNGIPCDKPEVFYVLSRKPTGAREGVTATLRRGDSAASAASIDEGNLLFTADLHDLDTIV